MAEPGSAAALPNGECAAPGPGNKVTVVLGAQWGDEGKGKVVDLLAQDAHVVCRCQVRSHLHSSPFPPPPPRRSGGSISAPRLGGSHLLRLLCPCRAPPPAQPAPPTCEQPAPGGVVPPPHTH